MATTFLTSKERQEYDAVPQEISRREVIQYFTITPDDLAEISLCRRKAHHFGFALQVCYLRWLGRFPDDVKATPAATLQFLSEQLALSSDVLTEYAEQTRIGRVHRQRICQHLGYREFGCHRGEVAAWLLPLAREHDFARGLLDALIEHPRREKIVRPGISTLERLVTQVRNQAQKGVRIERYITPSGDEDWFRFDLTAVSGVDVQLTSLPADYDVYLYNATGRLIGFSVHNGRRGERITLDRQPTGNYYVQVVGYAEAWDETDSYQLWFKAAVP